MQRMKETERKALYLLHGPKYSEAQGYHHASLVSEVFRDN
jgi:competence protein ComK